MPSYYFINGGGAGGTRGPTGPSGLQGPQGASGISGITGLPGITGLQGAQGSQGAQGIQGTTGIQGPSGLQGASGLQGVTGTQGGTGLMGGTGLQGPQGRAGSGSVGTFVQLTDLSFSTYGPGQSLFYNGANSYTATRGFGNIVNVMDFGASGNGVTDDRVAIQNAVNRINSGDAHLLYFPGPAHYIMRADTHPSGFNPTGSDNTYPFIKITNGDTKVVFANDAQLTIVANFSLSGDVSTISKAPLFGIYAGNCRIEGGRYNLSATGTNILNTGDAYNGYPIYYNVTTDTTWSRVTFSGFAGTSFNSGLLHISNPEEYIENAKFLNCYFLNWGGGYRDGLIQHQGHTLFDRCFFIQRNTTGTPGTIKEHGSALIVRSLISNIKYYDCWFENIGGGFGNLAYEIDILSTGIQNSTFMARSINIDRCQFINSRRQIPINGRVLYPLFNNNKFIYNFTGTATQAQFLGNTLAGISLSGAWHYNINNQNNIRISVVSGTYGMISDNKNCNIDISQSTGACINSNRFESHAYKVTNGLSIIGEPDIKMTDCNAVLMANNIFKYDNNTGIVLNIQRVGLNATQIGFNNGGNYIAYNHFESVGNFPSGYPINLSGATRTAISSNFFRQSGLITNHSIYINATGQWLFGNYMRANFINLLKSNIFEATNATGGFGPVFIDSTSNSHTLSTNIELGIRAASIIQNPTRNKTMFNFYSTSGNVGTGVVADIYNFTGSP